MPEHILLCFGWNWEGYLGQADEHHWVLLASWTLLLMPSLLQPPPNLPAQSGKGLFTPSNEQPTRGESANEFLSILFAQMVPNWQLVSCLNGLQAHVWTAAEDRLLSIGTRKPILYLQKRRSWWRTLRKRSLCESSCHHKLTKPISWTKKTQLSRYFLNWQVWK